MSLTYIRVMIVEDQDLVRESLALLLDREPDMQIVGMASNGREAVELCTVCHPDIVLMDIRMPEMDGVIATQLIKSKMANVKIIMLTSYEETHYVQEAIGVGAEGYMLKAMRPQQVTLAIRLVHEGGTFIPQQTALRLITELNELKHVHLAGDARKLPPYGLSDREWKVLECLSNGLGNAEIANYLFLSEGTVRNYISSIYSKLEVKSRREARRKSSEERFFQ